MLKNKVLLLVEQVLHRIEKIIDNNEVIIFDNLNRDTLGLTNISSHDNSLH